MTKQHNEHWRKLLEEENPQKTQSTTWSDFIGPILGFKLYTVLSGSAAVEGKIPRSIMAPDLAQKLTRIVSFPTFLSSAIEPYQGKVNHWKGRLANNLWRGYHRSLEWTNPWLSDVCHHSSSFVSECCPTSSGVRRSKPRASLQDRQIEIYGQYHQ